MIFEFFWFFFKNRGQAGSSLAIWAGPKLAQPKAKLIILVAACRMNSACSNSSSEQQGRLMQGRDGEPPEAVRAYGRAGGEVGGGVDGELGCRSCYCAGWRSLQRREKGRKEKRERVVVAAWWLCWLPVVELVFVVVYRSGLLVFSPEKAAGEEVERVVEDWRGKKENENRGKAGFLWFLDLIFSSSRSPMEPLFIGSGRG